MSIKDELKAACSATVEPVRVDGWDMDVFVRRPPAGLRDEFERVAAAQESKEMGSHEAMVRYVGLCLCNEDGQLVLDYKEDLDILREKDSEDLMVVFNAALSVIGADAIAEELGVRTGNSDGAPASGSDSA